MSVDNADKAQKRRGLFRRKNNNNGSSHQNSSNNNNNSSGSHVAVGGAGSFDEMESLGMGSGSASFAASSTHQQQQQQQQQQRNQRSTRFKLRRSKDDTSTNNHNSNSTERPDVITTRPRARSIDEVSFDGSSIRDSNSAAGGGSVKESRLLGKLGRRLRGGGSKKNNNSKQKSDPPDEIDDNNTGGEASSLQQPLVMDHIDSFDSGEGDDMLKHVRNVDPNTSFRRQSRSKRSMESDPFLSSEGGFSIGTDDGQAGPTNDDGPPIKRISFQEDTNDAADLGSSSYHRKNDFNPNANLRGSMFRDRSVMAPPEGSFASQASLASTQTYRSMGANETATERARYSVRDGTRANRASKKKFRVRPYQCFNDAVHMTEEEIYNDSTKPSLFCEMLKSYLVPSTKSHKKIPVMEDIGEKYGSPKNDGRIGSLRVEVLGCVSLARKSKPDVCVYLIAGDCAFCTDVIQGYRSPMWPSVSRRAAVFPIHHAYTRLYAGVFDVKSRKNKDNDVFCGRVCIDIASLRPNTEYDVTFPLRHSAFVYDRHKRGVLRLRFSLHWFSERAAVLSYFSSPQTLDKTSPLVQGSPTIPCADPKTFRNVAVTVHGNDLPGKYSRLAFKATVREFQSYQLNLRFMLKYLVIDAVMYEKPYISLYLFFAGMHCVITESVSKVPPYFVGFLIILFLENYKHYVADTAYNEGYQQLTLLEVFKALVSKSGSEDKYFEPILVTKRAKQRRNNPRTIRRIQADSQGSADAGYENIAVDHKEFPFSDRKVYPKFSVENALAPSSRKNTGGHTRLHGRLSVYYAPTPDAAEAAANNSDEDEDDESSDESDGDQTIMEGAGMYDSAFDLDDVDEDEDPLAVDQPGGATSSQYGYGDAGPYGYGGTQSTAAGATTTDDAGKIRKIIHFAQDVDDAGGAAVPPQVTVKRVENIFHKNSYSLAVEKVVAPPTKEHLKYAMSNDSTHNQHQQEKLALTTEEIEKEIEKKRKAYLDEFDKLLGLQQKGSNPLSRMFATFLGPLMRILRIPIFILRIAFNASTWRDPYLSFWLFCFMCLSLLILMAFPWRLFFLLVTLVGLGPQNIFLRKFLEKRAQKRKEKEMEKQDGGDASVTDSVQSGAHLLDHTPGNSMMRRQKSDDTETLSSRSETRRGFFGGMKKKRKNKAPVADSTDFFIEQDRPPFTSNTPNNKRKELQPRSVVIPYSKLRKERFYDWPPDPTVSRATPMEFETWNPDQVPEEILENKSSEEQQLIQSRRLSTGAGPQSNQGGKTVADITALRRRRGSL